MLIIGITGGSGSGKTTFAKKVQKLAHKNITLIHMDSYYLNELPQNIKNSCGKPNFDHPHAFDWELLRLHLLQLKNGHSIEMPKYNFSNNSRETETVSIKPSEILIIEGIFTLHDLEIRDMLDIKCFLHVDADIRFIRRLHRDIEERGRTLDSVIEQYYETVRPMYRMFLEPQQQYADFIVGEETTVAATILASKINHYLNHPQEFHYSMSVIEQQGFH